VFVGNYEIQTAEIKAKKVSEEPNSEKTKKTIVSTLGPPLLFGSFTVKDVDDYVDELVVKKYEEAGDRSKELHQFLFAKIYPRTDKSFNDQLKTMNNMGLTAPRPEDQEVMLKTLKVSLEGIVLLYLKKNLTNWNETDEADTEETSSSSSTTDVAGTKKKAGRRSGELGVNHKMEIARFKKICVTVANLRKDDSRKCWYDEGLKVAFKDYLKRKEAGTEEPVVQPKAGAKAPTVAANVGINFDTWTGEKIPV